MGSYTKAKLQ